MEKIKKAIKKNLGLSIPFLDEIVEYIFIYNQNFARSSFLIQCARLFRSPDEKIINIGTTLEFLYTATSLHRNINEFDNSRLQQKYVQTILGSEASVLLGDYLLSISFKILTHIKNLDILECVSLATKNISRGQVMEISEPNLLANRNHWYRVIKYKIAGLYGVGAQSAAYWGKASKDTASKLFAFGEHYGIATQIKKDLESLEDKKIVKQKLKNKDLLFPLCFLIHDCLNENERKEISKKLRKDFNIDEMSEEIFALCKKFEIDKKLRVEGRKEIKKAEDILNKLKIDTTNIRPLTIF